MAVRGRLTPDPILGTEMYYAGASIIPEDWSSFGALAFLPSRLFVERTNADNTEATSTYIPYTSLDLTVTSSRPEVLEVARISGRWRCRALHAYGNVTLTFTYTDSDLGALTATYVWHVSYYDWSSGSAVHVGGDVPPAWNLQGYLPGVRHYAAGSMTAYPDPSVGFSFGVVNTPKQLVTLQSNNLSVTTFPSEGVTVTVDPDPPYGWGTASRLVTIQSNTAGTVRVSVTGGIAYNTHPLTAEIDLEFLMEPIVDPLMAIDVQGTATLDFGAPQQFTAIGTYLSGTTRDITDLVEWGLQ